MADANGKKIEDLKTVKVDVQAVIAEVKKTGLLTPEPAPAPKPASSPAIVVTGGRIIG